MKNPPEFHNHLKKNYKDFENVKFVKLIDHNNINSVNLLVRSNKKYYVLRYFIDNSKPAKIEKICQILDFCLLNNVKVQKPIKNKKNEYVIPNKKLYLTKFYEGHPYSGKKIELLDLAKSLAKLHNVLSKNHIQYNYRPNQKFYKVISLIELFQISKIITKKRKSNDFINSVTRNLDILKKLIKKDQIITNNIESLKFKKQLIHSDLHPGNVIFNNNKVAALIDFNSMHKSVKMEDISFTSFRFTALNSNDVNVIAKQIRDFLKTYQLVNKIDPNEIENFNYFLSHKILERVSYILRKSFFYNSNLWNRDFEKNIQFLKLTTRLSLRIKGILD